MKQHKKQLVALSLLAAMSATTFGAALTPAQAIGTNGKRNIAIAGAAVGAYGLLKGKKKVAIAGAAVGAGSYLWYRKSKKKDEQRRQAWYRQRYGRNWRNHYRSGS